MLSGFLARGSKYHVSVQSATQEDRPEPEQLVALAKGWGVGEESEHLEDVVNKALRGCDVVLGDSSYILGTKMEKGG